MDVEELPQEAQMCPHWIQGKPKGIRYCLLARLVGDLPPSLSLIS